MAQAQGNALAFKDIWWMILLQGIVLILFGIFAMVWPGLTLAILAVAFALLLLVQGVVDIIVGVMGFSKRSLWFLTLLAGVLQVGLGVFLLRHSLVTLATFIALVGLALIVQGVFRVITAFESNYDGGEKFLLVTIGVLGVVVGAIVLANPVSGGLAFVWALGLYGVVVGAISVAMGLSIRSKLEAA